MEILSVPTKSHTEIVDVTALIQESVRKSGVDEGICLLYVPHTTCAVTVNENWDSDVKRDILSKLDRLVPWEDGYRHSEGNSAAHMKTLFTGVSLTLIIHEGKLFLGTWQGIYFTEYDGPRERKLAVKCISC